PVSCTDGNPLPLAVATFVIFCPVQAAAGAPPALVVCTTTVADALAARLPKLQVSTWLAFTVQVPTLVLTTPQVSPPVVGSGSLSVTFCATPGPVLVTTIVKVSGSPMLNVPFFGLLVMVTPAGAAHVHCGSAT